MTGQELYEARVDLGMQLGLGRPLHAAELGRLLQLRGRDPGRQVLRWETGENPIPGMARVCVEMMLRGARPEVLQTMERPGQG